MYLGKDLEGLELAKEVAGCKPIDLVTLGNLDKVFVATNDYKSAMSMFEDAFKLSPTEDVGAHWYFSVLRAQEPKSLFSIALKLHSVFKETRYLFWSILALHIQSRSPASSLSDTNVQVDRALHLAEKMILRVFTPSQIEERNLDELLLLITTLQGTKNYDEALRILDSASKIRFPNEDEFFILKADLLNNAGHYGMLREVSYGLINKKGIFDWNIWKLYVNSIDKSDKKEELVKSLPGFISEIESKTDLRSIMLAKIDAGILFGKEYCTQQELVDHIVNYISEFKTKGCCIPDMLHVSKSLEHSLVHALISICSSKSISSVEDLLQNLIWYQLGRTFSARIGHNDQSHVDNIGLIKASIKSMDNVRDSTALSSALYFLTLMHIDRGSSFWDILQAADFCREAVLMNPENFGNKLVLILLYLKLGSVTLPLQIFRSLDIKQLQLDTLAYLISDHLIELGDLEHAEIFLHESFFIYDENRTQSWSLIAEAISRSSYANVPEFFEFARRLEYSIQAVACICGTIRHELLTRDLQTLSNYLEGLKSEELIFDDDFMKNLSDNRDRDIIEFVDPAGVVKKVLLDTLPTFGRTSILVYTFLPIFLRGLAFGNLEFYDLSEKFSSNMKSLDKKMFTAMDHRKFEFIKNFATLCDEYERGQRDFSILVNGLRLIHCSSDHSHLINMNFDAENMPEYDFLSEFQCVLEMGMWVTLSLAFAVMGTLSSKGRKSCKIIASDLLSDIKKSFFDFRNTLTRNRDSIQSLQCPITLVSKCLWSDLVASWCQTLESYIRICDNGLKVLQSIFAL